MESRERALLKKIRIDTGKKMNSLFSGEYISAFRGHGLSFERVREYSYGDDARSIDWNVSARAGHLYVREYTEERELNIVLAIDVSASTDFGFARKKLELSHEFAALMLYLAQINGDRVSVLLFSEVPEKYLRPKKGRKFVLKVLDEIINFIPSGKKTSISSACEFLERVLKKRSVIFFVSDFISPDEDFEPRINLLSRRHDMIPVRVSDPFESGKGFPCLAEFFDLETGETYFSEPAEPCAIPQLNGFDQIMINTGEPIEKPLLAFFKKRNRMASHRSSRAG